jgi:hypothetical protein
VAKESVAKESLAKESVAKGAGAGAGAATPERLDFPPENTVLYYPVERVLAGILERK